MSHSYQIQLESISADLEKVHGPNAVEAMLAGPRDLAITALTQFAKRLGDTRDLLGLPVAWEAVEELLIQADKLGITFDQKDVKKCFNLLIALYLRK
jgi:hypothetical protein